MKPKRGLLKSCKCLSLSEDLLHFVILTNFDLGLSGYFRRSCGLVPPKDLIAFRSLLNDLVRKFKSINLVCHLLATKPPMVVNSLWVLTILGIRGEHKLFVRHYSFNSFFILCVHSFVGFRCFCLCVFRFRSVRFRTFRVDRFALVHWHAAHFLLHLLRTLGSTPRDDL